MPQNIIKGMDFTEFQTEQVEFCETCCQAKTCWSPFNNETQSRAYVSIHLCCYAGSFPTQSLEGYEYSLTF